MGTKTVFSFRSKAEHNSFERQAKHADTLIILTAISSGVIFETVPERLVQETFLSIVTINSKTDFDVQIYAELL
ncbi:MAG: hypothetical protein LBK58_03500, partial [Prevotellaceae bacterium]|nr:hypothetical protein [Prevotellaceae bacterium]